MGLGMFGLAPDIAFAAGNSAHKTGAAVIHCLILLLLAWGIYKSFSIARRKTTNTKCVISLGLSLAGFFIVSAGTVAKMYLFNFGPLTGISLILAGVFFITSMVLAVVGLIDYNQEFTQGKKQAVWAILLSSLVIILVVSGIVISIVKRADMQKEMYATDAGNKPIVHSDLNFTLEVPGKPYAKIKPEKMNPFAKVAFMRGKPQVFYMLIPERIGIDQGMKTEDLLDIAQAALKGGAQRLESGQPLNKMINGMNGLYIVSDAKVKNREISYVHWVFARNGFSYQQIGFSETKNKAVLIAEAEKLFAGFKQIDPDAFCYSEGSKPLGLYESGQFGYSLDLRGAPWIKWTDVNETIPGADIGGQTGDGLAAFIVSAFSLEQVNPGHDAIIDAFLQSMSIDRNNEKLTLLSEEQITNFHNYTFSYSGIKEGTLLDFRIKISIGPDKAFSIVVWTDKKISKVEGFFSQIDESIQYFSFRPSSESQRFDDHGRKVMADILNRVGIIFENRKDYENAARYYTFAVAYDPADEIIWDNAMKNLNRQKKHKMAVQLFKRYDQKIRFDNSTISWYAWHLAQSGNKPEALKKYQYLFSSGYTNAEDFKYYITLLAESGNLEAVDPAYDSYLKQQDNQALRINQAQTWYGQKQFEKALAVLEKLDKTSPDVILEQIYNLQGLERHKEALNLCDRLISGIKYPGDGYYLKGKSEYHLRWYTKAKKSFEKSSEYFPGNETINGYLKELSGILGQGDNSIIKRKIPSIPLPEKIAERMDKPVDPEYIKGNGAYFLQYCFGYQWGADGVLKSTLRHKVRIVNSAGANNFSTYTIDFNPLYEQLYVNSLVVRDREGNVIAKGDEDSYFIIDQQNSNLKNHDQTLNMPIPQLVPGCTIEIVATKILGHYDHFPFTERLLAGRYPILNSMVYVLGDAEKYYLKALNGVKTETFSKGKMAYTYSPMKYRREPKQQHYKLILPCVYINGRDQDWSEQGENYLKKIQKQLIITDDIKKLSLSLIDNDDAESEKIAKLYHYLQKNYKYLGIEFGSRGEIPYEASKTVNNKFGDCKDHAVLFHHLLKSAGISNYLALVNSNHPVQDDMPSRDQFDHIINYIPGKTGRFLDATDKDSATDLSAPTYLAGSQALILEPGNVRFLKIPDYNAQDTHIYINKVFRVEDKILHVNETLEMNGHYAAFMRNFLKNKNTDRQQAWVQATILSYYPSGQLEKFEVKNLMENDKPIIIDSFYSVSGRIHPLKKKLMVKTSGIWESNYLLSEPVNNRKTKFEIEIPFLLVSHNVMEVPEGFEISEYPKELFSSKTDFGDFNIKFSTSNNTLEYHLRLTARKGVFPKDEYQAYYEFKQLVLQAASPNISLATSN